ncbi:hypothetical protein Vretimale_11190 [Volvox reticuliferus]|uniref:Uncharacterized protein n=1 Tax=Volvox reticuliferus TaxID=1737510 RepID=A0A8J4LRS8_9CHLO|nr:hypothetical protein Vretimale_11190 [Volvox reticuliferus]
MTYPRHFVGTVGSNSSRAQPLQKMENMPPSPAAVQSQTNKLAAISKQVTPGRSHVDLHTLVGTALKIKSKNPNATVTFSLPASALTDSIGSGMPYVHGSFSLSSASAAEDGESPDPLAPSPSAAAATVLVNTPTGTFYTAGIQNDTLALMRLLIQMMRQHPGSSVTVTLRDTGNLAPGESPLQVAVRLDAAFSSEYATPVVSWGGGDDVTPVPKATVPSVSTQDYSTADTRPQTASVMTIPSGLLPPPASQQPIEVNLESPMSTSPSLALPPAPSSSGTPTLTPSWTPALSPPLQSPGGSSELRLEPVFMPSSPPYIAASPAGLSSQTLASPANLSIKVINRDQQQPPTSPPRPPVRDHADPNADNTDQPSAWPPLAPPVYCSPLSRPAALQLPNGITAAAPISPSPINLPAVYLGPSPVPRSRPSLYDCAPPKSMETNSPTAYNGMGYLPSASPPTQPNNPPPYPERISLPSAWPPSPDPQTLSQSSLRHLVATMPNPTMSPSQQPALLPATYISHPPVQPVIFPTYPAIDLAVSPSPRPWHSHSDSPPVYADLPSSASQRASTPPSYIAQLPTENEEPIPAWDLPARPRMRPPASYGSQSSLTPPAGPAAYPYMPLAPSLSLLALSKPDRPLACTDSLMPPQQQHPALYGSQPAASPARSAAYPEIPLPPSSWTSPPAPAQPSYPAPPPEQPVNVGVYSNILPSYRAMHPSSALGQHAGSPSKVWPASNFPSPALPSRRSPSRRHVNAIQQPSYVPSASVQPTRPLAYPIRQPPMYTSSSPLQLHMSPPADQDVSSAQPPIYPSSQCHGCLNFG